ncbi:MAG: NADPH-dependent F420 reductase [Acidobacteria bacterium]|nr:NADPH-dependent F420 reductase [Acidobacteriota bacterium]
MKIGILGGTGIEGTGVALRYAQAGFSVAIGSRSAEKAQVQQNQLTRTFGKALFSSGENKEVASSCDLVFLATPFEFAADVLKSCRSYLRSGTVVVDLTVPLVFKGGTVEVIDLAEGSASEHLVQFIPQGVSLVGALKTVPAHLLADIHEPLDCDDYICGDSEEAKKRVIEAEKRIESLRPLDAGPLKQARTLERMCAMVVWFNRKYKSKTSRFRVIGLEKLGSAKPAVSSGFTH